MSNLQDLYKAIETFRRNDIPIDEKTSKRLDEAEEQIIRDEILPIITKDIEPTLRQIQRKIVLVVDYDPNSQISVRMTRKRVVTDAQDTKEYPLLPLSKPTKSVKPQKRHEVVNPRTRLRVTFPDGNIIDEKKALNTFIAVLERLGLTRVESLHLSTDGQNLVTRHPIDNGTKASWHQAGEWFINCHSSTGQKAGYLNRISKALNSGLKVEVI